MKRRQGEMRNDKINERNQIDREFWRKSRKWDFVHISRLPWRLRFWLPLPARLERICSCSSKKPSLWEIARHCWKLLLYKCHEWNLYNFKFPTIFSFTSWTALLWAPSICLTKCLNQSLSICLTKPLLFSCHLFLRCDVMIFYLVSFKT